jgi:type I restriction enzyme S subunit
MSSEKVPFTELLSKIIDNRGRTCPTSQTGLPLIATNCIRNDSLYPVFEKVRYVSDEVYDNWFRSHPIPGDLIFVCKGTPGRVCLTPDPVNFCIAQDMVAVRADPRKIYPKYLLALLRSDLVQSQIGNMHVGTLIPHFKKGDFDKLVLPVPDRKVQEAIGDMYFEFSEKIELNRKMNETLEQMARALFKSWFIDFDPVRAKMEGRQPEGMDAETAALFPSRLVESELGLIPEGWEVCPLSERIELISGGTPRTTEPVYWGGDIPWFSVKDAPVESDVWVIETEKHVTTDGLHNSSAQILSEGTTIISARGTVGKLALVGTEMAMNQSCYGIRGIKGYGDYFTFFVLRHATVDIQQRTHGSVFDTITRETFETLPSVYPTGRVAAEFDRTVDSMLTTIRNNVYHSRTLASLRDTLLPQLMRG